MGDKDIVNVSKLRARLNHYLEQLTQGSELTLVRHSQILGKLHLELDPRVKEIVQSRLPITHYKYFVDDESVMFRQFGAYEDPAAIVALNRTALKHAGLLQKGQSVDERDLLGVGASYGNAKGEFWIGELAGEVVAMGGFHAAIGLDRAPEDAALLRRLRVRPDLQGKGVGSYLLRLLEERARKYDYAAIVLDFNDTERSSPRKLYESKGYQQVGQQGDLLLYQKLLL